MAPSSWTWTARHDKSGPALLTSNAGLLPSRLVSIRDVGALCLARIRVVLQEFDDPLPPFGDVLAVQYLSLGCDPQLQTIPAAANPTPDHPIQHVVVDDSLEHHGPPHLAGAVNGKRSIQECRIVPDHLRLDPVREGKNVAHRLPDFLGLHCPHDTHRRGVATVATGIPELDDGEDHTCENCEG